MSSSFRGVVRPLALPILTVLLWVAPTWGSLPQQSSGKSAGEAVRAPSVPELVARGSRPFVPDPKGAVRVIRLGNGFVFDTRDGEPPLASELRSREAPLPDERIALLVQVEAPVRTEWIGALERAGAAVEFFVPNYAFLVRIDARNRAAVERLPFVVWTGFYHPAYRISGQDEMLRRSGRGEYSILLFDDADVSSVVSEVRFLGGEIDDSSDNGLNKILRVRLDRGVTASLAAHAGVQWIEPRERFTTSNDQVQWVDQTNVSNNRKVWDHGIDGTGQVVMVGDSGIRTSHDMFRDNSLPITSYGDYESHRKIIAYMKSMPYNTIDFGDHGPSYHGSHTSCTFVGNDNGFGSSSLDGIAKGAKIYFLDCGGPGEPTNVFTPGDLNDYYGPAYEGNAGGAARVSSNSWGAPVGGEYTISSMTTDQFSWNHKDFLICFSNGNSGSGGSNTVGSPATAKNILSSGGTQNGSNANRLYTATSRGPTDDGRRKPTVCSPGQSVRSARGSGDSAYQFLSGTSMSCPNLAGSSTLTRQYFMDGFYPTGTAVAGNAFTPSAALLRAMMVNSGVDDFSSHSIPDHNIGWGRILLDNVLYFPGDNRRTVILDEEDGVATGEVREYEIYVADNSEDLKVTLVWTDFPSTPAAAINVVNDLDLVVEDGSSTYLGNVWSGGQSVTGGSRDDLNVEENVRRASPGVGNYTIRVEGANVPIGPQPYALVISGGLGGDAGVLVLDAASYGPGKNVGIRVEDTDAGASVTLTASSTTEAGETLVIPGTNGVYEALLPLTLGTASSGDGELSVAHGDIVTVTYVDSSPSHTSVASATVNADDPEITNVAADPAGVTAVITWDTNTLATSQIEFGTTAALGSFSVLDEGLSTSHSHLVQGLAPETTFFYDVLSTDHQGNLVRDDFGGQHYRFTTGQRADVLLVNADGNTTEAFDSTYDPALETTGWTYNVWGKTQADQPEVGDLSSGLRSYKAVWWQVGWEQYPPFDKPARESLRVYHDGGARLALSSHDLVWSFCAASGFNNQNRCNWVQDVMHASYDDDPLTGWNQNVGIPGDPISGGYTGGVSYTPHREGAAGDEIELVPGTGVATSFWRNNNGTPDDVGVRWENGAPNGTAGNGVWGGTPTKTAAMFFEWMNVNAATVDDPIRADILDRTLQWLIGGDHPDATVIAPNGGEAFVSSPVSISWTSATDAASGRNLASTRLEYSDDGGHSWNLITAAPGTSPYSWNVSSLSTGDLYRVRVVVTDDGSPDLAGSGVSDANFTIAVPGNENRGPVVLAGSPGISPNPIIRPDPAVLTATLSDELTGGSAVTAAEWSVGAAPAPAGSGTGMTGAFGTVDVDVSANIDSVTLPSGSTSLWIRGRDAAGNWGAAGELAVQVNGSATGVETAAGAVTSFAIAQNYPNPFIGDTRIRFALPDPTAVDLRIYNVQGRLVRTLLTGPVAAGRHALAWDGKDEKGERVSSGIYFYRISTDKDEAQRKMVLLK